MTTNLHPSRRQFLTRSGLLLAGATMAPTILGACGSDDAGGDGGGGDGGDGGRTTFSPNLIDVPAGSAGAVFRPVIEAQDLLGDLGLEPRWVGAQPAETQTSLLSGAVDIGTFGPIGAAQVNATGEEIRLIGPVLNNHVRWIVRGDSPYQSIGDLRGEAIGTQPETTATYQTTMMTAILAGIDFQSEYNVSTGAPPALLALFERGDLEALAITEPTATVLVAGGARDIGGVTELWAEHSGASGRFPLSLLAAKQGWVDDNPDAYRAVTSLYREVLEYLEEDTANIVEFAEAIGIPPGDDAAMDLVPERLGYVYESAWDDDAFVSLDRQLEVAVEVGILDALPEDTVYLPAPS